MSSSVDWPVSSRVSLARGKSTAAFTVISNLSFQRVTMFTSPEFLIFMSGPRSLSRTHADSPG